MYFMIIVIRYPTTMFDRKDMMIQEGKNITVEFRFTLDAHGKDTYGKGNLARKKYSHTNMSKVNMDRMISGVVLLI